MNEIFERLKKLLAPIGISFEEKGISNGEIYSYAVGLFLAGQAIKNSEEEIFFLSGNSTLEKIAELLKINTSLYSRDYTLQLIKDKLKHGFADYTFSEILELINVPGIGSAKLSGDKLYFSGFSSDSLGEIGKFIESFCPFWASSRYSGDGMSFDDWNAFDKTFGVLDSFMLPFSIIDSLRRDDFEQH